MQARQFEQFLQRLSSLTRRQRDRSGQTIDAVTGKGSVSKRQLVEHLGPRLERDVLLVTDSHAAYPAFARELGISHEAINASPDAFLRAALGRFNT